MEQKINVAELLKDCPSGMELDCTICDNVHFDKVTPHMIKCYIKNDTTYNSIYFYNDGNYLACYNAKCVIFPKGKTTWEGFQRPFKDGDVVSIITNKKLWYGIYQKEFNDILYCYVSYSTVTKSLYHIPNNLCSTNTISEIRLATEEEKQKLFKAIKDNGYKWNPESKTLEKLIFPKFKVGDKIKKKGDTRLITISDVRDNCYIIKILDYFGHCCITGKLSFSNQNNYELVPKKFDITTLKPFESRVLVRSSYGDIWRPAIYGFTDSEKHYVVGGNYWAQCIPYEVNKELLGTTNNPKEYGGE